MIDEINKFWKLFKPTSDNSYTEIRLTPNNIKDKNEFYKNINTVKKYCDENNIIFNKISFFTNRKNDIINILELNNNYFVNNGKTCYGVNHRYTDKDGSIDGTYNSLKYFEYIYFDVERTNHEDIKDNYKELFDLYVQKIINILEKYNLFKPSIIMSGAGKHLIYKIKPVRITQGRKYWFKTLLKDKISVRTNINNGMFIIDGLADATRILGLPGTMNVKRGKKIVFEKLSLFVNNFNFGTKKIKKHEKVLISNVNDFEIKNIINNSLELQVLLHNAPVGNRHTHLVFALKLLFKKYNFLEVEKYESAINSIYGGSVNLDYRNGTEDKYYTKSIILGWCNKNIDFINKHSKLKKIYSEYLRK